MAHPSRFISVAIILFMCACVGCAPMKNVQLFYTSSENCREVQDLHIYENDTVVIAYYFWANRGVMGFSVFNKLTVPLYIDWKKSSFVLNGEKLNYFSEDVNTSTVSETHSVSNSKTSTNSLTSLLYAGPALKDYIKSTRTFSNKVSEAYALGFSQSVTTKDERVTFIPPKSYFTSSKHYLSGNEFFTSWGNDYTKKQIDDPEKPNSKKKLTVYTKSFNKNDSPNVFRNFLTLSTRESIENEFYVDNPFYVSKIESMDYRGFVYSKELPLGYEEFCPHVSGVRYYLDKNPKWSVIKIHNL